MSSTANRSPMLIIDIEKIAIKDMPPPPFSDPSIFPFLKLPRELRDPIYRHLIRDGDIAILQLSKLVNEEASECLSTHATFRINLGFVTRTNWSELGSAVAVTSSAQHIDIRITGTSDANPSKKVISGFFNKQIIRESCVVTLNYGRKAVAAQFTHEKWALYRMLASLGGFKKLLVKIVVERWEAAEFQGISAEERFHAAFPYDTGLVSFHKVGYLTLQDYLVSKFGSAKFHDTVEGPCLEFYPPEPLPEERNPEDDEWCSDYEGGD